MKTLIEIDPRLWGKVKDFATVNRISLSTAVTLLLSSALGGRGYNVERANRGENGALRHDDI